MLPSNRHKTTVSFAGITSGITQLICIGLRDCYVSLLEMVGLFGQESLHKFKFNCYQMMLDMKASTAKAIICTMQMHIVYAFLPPHFW